jgi:NitT/TauT family transport system substrate-binding protein
MKIRATLLAFVVFLAAQSLSAQTKKIPVAYSAISATQAGFYLTKEMGIFEKNGLAVDMVYVAGGTRIAQALIANEFPVALAGGAIVNANLAGGDIAVVGGVVNVPAFYVYVNPSIKKPEDLKGKALGITTYGSSTDFTLRYLVRKWGLEPDRDVKIIQAGGQPEILAGMQAGALQGGNLSSPGDFKARKLGFALLTDFKTVGLDYPTVSLVSTRSYIKKDQATVKRFITAYSEGVHRLFTDKDLGMKIIAKYTRTQDREVLESSYAYATNFIEKTPRLPVKGLETILEQLAATNPKAKQHKAEDFVDASFYNDLDKSGFFKNLWR